MKMRIMSEEVDAAKSKKSLANLLNLYKDSMLKLSSSGRSSAQR